MPQQHMVLQDLDGAGVFELLECEPHLHAVGGAPHGSDSGIELQTFTCIGIHAAVAVGCVVDFQSHHL